MTEEQLRAAYPGAADAVVQHERHSDAMEWHRRLGGSPQVVWAGLRRAADIMLAKHPEWEDMRAIRPQMDHPDFLRCVGAKLGMM